MNYFKLFSSIAVCVALYMTPSPASAQVQWGYSFDVNGNAQAKYPGAVVVGNPTGGSEGLGSLNAQSIFVNGVPVDAGLPTGGNLSPLVIPNTCISTYCIDSVNGNDAGSGSATSPWKTPCDPANASARLGYAAAGCGTNVLAGQSVGLACGSMFRRAGPNASSILNLTSNGVIVSPYNSSPTTPCSQALYNTPILNASDAVANASMTSLGGGVATFSVTFVLGGTASWANVWETGATTDSVTGQFLSNQTSQANVISTPCSYYVPGMTTSNLPTGSVTVSIHSCDGSNPVTNGFLYEIGQASGLKTSGLQDAAFNVQGWKNADPNGSLVFGTDGSQDYGYGLIARDGSKHNLFMSSGSTLQNSWMLDGYYNVSSTGDAYFVMFNSTANGMTPSQLTLNVNGLVCESTQLTAGNGESTCMISHTGDSTTLGNVSLNNIWVIGQNNANEAGFAFANIGAVTANQIYGININSLISATQNWTVTNSQFISDYSNNGGFWSTATPSLTSTFDNVKVCVSNNSFAPMRMFSGATGEVFNLTRSFLFARFPAGVNGANLVSSDPSDSGNTFKFFEDDFGSQVQFYKPLDDLGSGNTFSTSSNANTYEAYSFSPQYKLNNTTYSTLSTWQAAVTPADSNAIQSGGSAFSACIVPTNMPVLQ